MDCRRFRDHSRSLSAPTVYSLLLSTKDADKYSPFLRRVGTVSLYWLEVRDDLLAVRLEEGGENDLLTQFGWIFVDSEARLV